MKDGITLHPEHGLNPSIEVCMICGEDGSDQKNPYRTGRYCAIKKEAAKKILGQEHSVVYMEKSAYSLIIL